MLFAEEKILIFHPGKCGGTTIEHLFLRTLRQTNLAELLNRPCFKPENNQNLSPACLDQRKEMMTGFISKEYALNGVFNIYLQHADIAAALRIHGRERIDSCFKIAFVRNPFPRTLSAYYYNMWDRKVDFRRFVLDVLPKRKKMNQDYTRNHFGDLRRYTHWDGRLYVDFVGRLEDIAADVARLEQGLDLTLNLEREHQHARTKAGQAYSHYSQAYNEEMVAAVSELYAEDLHYFNYAFERQAAYQPVDSAEEEVGKANGRKSFLSAFRRLVEKE